MLKEIKNHIPRPIKEAARHLRNVAKKELPYLAYFPHFENWIEGLNEFTTAGQSRAYSKSLGAWMTWRSLARSPIGSLALTFSLGADLALPNPTGLTQQARAGGAPQATRLAGDIAHGLVIV